MGPKYNNIYTLNDVDKIPNRFSFNNYKDCLYGLSNVVISLQKGMFAKKDITVYIQNDDLDGLDEIDFRRPKKQGLLRKRYVDEDEWSLALSQFGEENRVYYSFKEQTRAKGNHSAGKCLIDFEISQPDNNQKRICTVNMRASIVPYNLYFDLILIHNLISEARETCQLDEVDGVILNIGLLTVKRGVSLSSLVCLGYHWKDLAISNFFVTDINYMFDNIEHPTTFDIMRVGWDNTYAEIVDRIRKGEPKDCWRWKAFKVNHRNDKITNGTRKSWGYEEMDPELVALSRELIYWESDDDNPIEGKKL